MAKVTRKVQNIQKKKLKKTPGQLEQSALDSIDKNQKDFVNAAKTTVNITRYASAQLLNRRTNRINQKNTNLRTNSFVSTKRIATEKRVFGRLTRRTDNQLCDQNTVSSLSNKDYATYSKLSRRKQLKYLKDSRTDTVDINNYKSSKGGQLVKKSGSTIKSTASATVTASSAVMNTPDDTAKQIITRKVSSGAAQLASKAKQKVYTQVKKATQITVKKIGSAIAKVVIQMVLALAGFLLPILLIIIIVFVPILLLVSTFSEFFFPSERNSTAIVLPGAVEEWRPTVETYCDKYGIAEYVDLALALIATESSGNEPDPMQAAEGAYGLYCLKTQNENGGHSHAPNGIPTGHGECSINAGVQELRDALQKANVEGPDDIDHIMVAIQGYNFGMDGWINWINQHGGKYTLELATTYSITKMPTGAKGTPSHAQKVMQYYSTSYTTDENYNIDNGGNWRWPLNGYTTISSDYGWRSDPFSGVTTLHNGIDFPAPSGTNIHAVADGTVIWANYSTTAGNWTGINHGNGITSVYMHQSVLLVTPGTKVKKGDVIGMVGTTGSSTGNHLHLGVQKNGKYVNPWNHLTK